MTPQDRYTSCLFCGRTDLNKEHVLPLWLSRDLKSYMGTDHFTANTSRGQWKAGILNFQVRAFCEKHCNGGWMAQMENRTKPYLLQYALAQHPKTMMGGTQSIMATWAYKTFLTMSAWEGDKLLLPDAEYRRFYREQNPGGATVIWMGAYAGSKWASRFTANGVDLAAGGRVLDAPNNAITAVFNIYRAVFVILRWFGSYPIVGEDGSYLDPQGHLVRIWPTNDPFVLWPPGEAFSEEEFAGFKINVE